MADILHGTVPPDGFVGHLGGDDFIVILASYDADGLCGAIIERFDRAVKELYSEDDRQKGYIVSRDRKGETDQFPIMSLSISGVTNRRARFRNIYELSEYASRIPKKCKGVWKSCFFID